VQCTFAPGTLKNGQIDALEARADTGDGEDFGKACEDLSSNSLL
jgi:hypothetical protein